MHVLNQKIGKRVVGYIAGLILAYSVASSFISTHFLTMPRFEILYIAASMLLILIICFYNKVTTLITLTATALIIIWHLFFNNGLMWLLNVVFPFIKEAANYIQGISYLDDGYYFPLALAFVFVSVLFSFFTASKLRGSIVIIVVIGVLFISMWFYGHKHILMNLALCVAVALGVWVYSVGKSEILTIFVLLTLIIMSVLTVKITPNDVQNMRSTRIEIIFDDIFDYFGIRTNFERSYEGFSISDAGYGRASDLGGSVKLSSGMVMYVNGISPTLLRGSIYNKYTGRGWEDSESDSSYRYDSAIWRERVREVFDLERPSSEYASDAERLYEEVMLSIKPIAHLNTIFTPIRPDEVSSDYKDFIPYFNNKGEMFAKHGIRSSEEYRILGKLFHEFTEDTVQYMTELESLLPPEDEERMAEINRLYLPEKKLNHTTGIDTAEAIAISLASEHSGKFAQALAIRDYLKNNYTYTLTPPEVPSDVDFVEYFLETGEGYCSYFASAMAVMARTIGIPSRYIEGYSLTNIEPYDGVYKVTEENSHAWAELYFEGVGWIPFDATAAQYWENGLMPLPTEASQDVIDEPTFEEAEEEEANAVTDQTIDRNDKWKLSSWIGIILMIVILTVGLVATGITIQGVYYSETRLIRKYGRKTAIAIWWCKILIMLENKDKNFIRNNGETAYMLAERISNKIDSPIALFDQLTEIVVRSFYSDQEPEDEEVKLVAEYYTCMRKDIIHRPTSLFQLILQIPMFFYKI